MVELQDVSKVYPQGDGEVHALDAVNLRIGPGEFVMVTGRSGSGKTTLLSVIGGLTRPDAGEVRVAGKNLWSLGDTERSRFRCRVMGFVFQFASLIPTLPVMENVLLPTVFCHDGVAGLGRRARELLERVGLGDRAGSYPWQLSGGQQKRVAVVRALLLNPPLLLADEPTGDLDEETEIEILDLFRETNRAGTTIVVVTHNTGLTSYASRHLRMSQGRLEETAAGERT